MIGYVGLFFARLIKASVSRQREFLADASSVQFTRNPDGIAGALDQIRASTRGTLVANRYAEEIAHMFFGQGISVWLGGLFDTHPPIEERIRRVNPGFQPPGYRTRRAPAEAADAQDAAALPSVGFAAGAGAAQAQPAGGRAADLGVAWGRSAGESMALVGSLDSGKVNHAQRLLAALPAGLRQRLREPEGACAAVIALLLAPRDSVMEEQLAAVRAAGAAGAVRLADAAKGLARDLRGLGPAYHLGVVDLELPALKAAAADLQGDLIKALEAVINADRRVSINEFALLTLVRSQLAPRAPRSRSEQPRFRALADVRPQAVLLLALCAHAGSRPDAAGDADAELAFRAGMKELGFDDAPMPARDALALQAVGAALETLRGLAPLPKAVLVKGLFATVTADGIIRIIEAALMRMVGAVLDCPLPPLIEDLAPEQLAQ